ncbi:MAG TPA: aminoglycoside phosphotransferase family protein, partial [Gammaproteobacteria bacterium]|nr:aminoglycoside phosphotransferase family protein [Gammaproteobacteria bacterium]
MALKSNTTTLADISLCSPALTQNMLKHQGKIGQKWLTDLPDLLQNAQNTWQLNIGPCFPDAQFNFVAPVTRQDGSLAVLKCGLPSPAFTHEIAALRHFNGQGAVQLLQVDDEKGLMLLERIEPGTLLESHTDPEHATRLAVEVMQQLHKPLSAPATFQTLADLCKGFDDLYQRFDGKTGPFPS